MSDIQVTYRSQKSQQFAHIEWLELHNDSIMHECAVMSRDRFGNVLFFKLNDLDDIDKRRLVSILMDRNAGNLPLWDVMMNRTLGNGVNALAYFNQLVRMLTPNGKILDPKAGVQGISQGQVTLPTANPANKAV